MGAVPALPIDVFVQALKVLAEGANAARDKYKAATAKADTSWKSVAEANADNEDVKKFLAFEEKVNEQIAALQKKKGEARAATILAVTGETVTTVTPEEAKALKAEFLDYKRKYKATYDNTLIMVNGDSEALDKAITDAGIVQVNNLGGGSATAHGGEITRTRIASATVNGEDQGKTTFTTLSQTTKVPADDLRIAAAKAANVDSVKDLPKGETFEFEVTNKKNETFAISITTPAEKSE